MKLPPTVKRTKDEKRRKRVQNEMNDNCEEE